MPIKSAVSSVGTRYTANEDGTVITDTNGTKYNIEYASDGGGAGECVDTTARQSIEEILTLIPSGATTSNLLATAQDVATLLSKLGNYGKDSAAAFDSYFRIEFQNAVDSAGLYSFFFRRNTGGNRRRLGRIQAHRAKSQRANNSKRRLIFYKQRKRRLGLETNYLIPFLDLSDN